MKSKFKTIEVSAKYHNFCLGKYSIITPCARHPDSCDNNMIE